MEAPRLQNLAHEHQAAAIPDQELDPVRPLGAEDEYHPREGLESEFMLDDPCKAKAAHAAPHVRVPLCNPYPNARGGWKHGLTDRSTTDTNPGEVPVVMRTIARSNSTMIDDPLTGTGSGCTCTSAKLCAA